MIYVWGWQKGSSTSGWFALPGICRMHHICRHSTCICTVLAACFKPALLASPVEYGKVIPNQRLGSKGLHVFAHVVALAWPDLQIATLTCWRACSKQFLRLHGGHRDNKRF